MNNKLPKKPSDLLLVSLADLEMIESDPAYEINMTSWHKPNSNGVCEVCHAGAVMAGTLETDINLQIGPSCFDTDTYAKLESLDEFRVGHNDGFNYKNKITFLSGHGMDFDEVYEYSNSPVGSEAWQTYKDWIVDYAMFLKSEGY